jgi:hypothetical protein
MSQELPQVRIATPEDETALLAMCRRLWSENGLFSYNEEKVRDCLHKCYARKSAGDTPVIVGVIENNDGIIEASTCLTCSDYFYSDDWHLAELWNFVDEPYRKSKNIDALLEFGKGCAVKMGIPYITGIITNKSMAGKVRKYRRLLGHPAGAFFIYNAPWKSEPMEDHFELRARLKQTADVCNSNPKEVTFSVAQKKIAPLLAEAAEALGQDDNLWGGSKANGSAHAA